MELRVTTIDDNGLISIDCDDEGHQYLYEQGINFILLKAIIFEKTGEMYGVSDFLELLSKKSSKKGSRKSVE